MTRLHSYLQSAGLLALKSELSPADLQDVQLVMWSDADGCVDSEDTKSTSGLLLELLNPNTGRRWPISWAVRRQGSTLNSIAEAETVQYGGYGTDIGIEAVNSRNKKQKKHFETIERERGQLGSYSRCFRLMRLKILDSNLNEVLFESVRYQKPFK